IVAALVAAAVLIASGIGIGWGLSQGDRGTSSGFASPPEGGSDGGTSGNSPTGGATVGSSGNATQIAQGVLPAIVVIRTQIGTGAPGSSAEGGAAGTGMILTSDGQILTNNHVIRGATSIEVTTSNHSTYDAQVVGVDPTDDVALLQIDGASGLPTIARDTSNLT